MAEERLTRDQVPVDQTWDLSDIFASPVYWREGVARIRADIQAVAAFKGRLGDGAAVLLACLEAHETLMARLDRIRMYAYFNALGRRFLARESGDGRTGGGPDRRCRCLAIVSDVRTHGPARRHGRTRIWPRSRACAVFRALLDEILLARTHRLHPETEEVLAALGEVLKAPTTIWQLATAVDMTCAPAHDAHGVAVPVSIAAYASAHARSTDRMLRRSAYASLTAGLSRPEGDVGHRAGHAHQAKCGAGARPKVCLGDGDGAGPAASSQRGVSERAGCDP